MAPPLEGSMDEGFPIGSCPSCYASSQYVGHCHKEKRAINEDSTDLFFKTIKEEENESTNFVPFYKKVASTDHILTGGTK